MNVQTYDSEGKESSNESIEEVEVLYGNYVAFSTPHQGNEAQGEQQSASSFALVLRLGLVIECYWSVRELLDSDCCLTKARIA